VLRYESRPHAPLRVVLHSTTLAAHAAPRYLVHGTRGSSVKHGVDPLDGELVLPAADGTVAKRAWPTRAGDYVAYYAAVRDAILGQRPNPVPPEQAVALMELLDLGRRSAEEGRALPVARP